MTEGTKQMQADKLGATTIVTKWETIVAKKLVVVIVKVMRNGQILGFF